jgi:cobyrinic acid a,c-diamide synthase
MSGFIIAGVKSGVGKTTIASGIMSALTQSGYKVQPFKAGPDYIDPSYHTAACGNISRNLDSWLLEENVILELFNRSSSNADISIVEGVMGLFDGHSNLSDEGSTAHLAKLLNMPVILITDASKVARSVAAEVLGFKVFDKNVNIAGVILNGIGSERHLDFCKPQIEETTGIPVLGYMPRKPELTQPERHLGLIPTIEGKIASEWQQQLTNQIRETIDLDRLIQIAKSHKTPQSKKHVFPLESIKPHVRIAIAKDKAFNFYYQDSLDLLSSWGAELVPFSPLSDIEIPENCNGIYMGGGFPEVYADELSDNKTMKQSILSASKANIPIYAECGGLMYLGQNIINFDGTALPMTGVFKYNSLLENSRLTLGYREIESQITTPILNKNQVVKGHEFHWSALDEASPSEQPIYKIINQSNKLEGYSKNKTHATYIHVHLGSSSKNLASNFINYCAQN